MDIVLLEGEDYVAFTERSVGWFLCSQTSFTDIQNSEWYTYGWTCDHSCVRTFLVRKELTSWR